MTKKVLIKCFKPDEYDAADCAVIEVREYLVLSLYRRVLKTKRAYEESFLGIKWWDYEPTFIPTSGPDSVGLDDMDEEEFDRDLDGNSYVVLPDGFDARAESVNYAPMSPVVLTVTASSGPLAKAGSPMCGFYWTGTDKYIGTRVEMYEMPENVIDEWAELIGCTEALAKVSRCMVGGA